MPTRRGGAARPGAGARDGTAGARLGRGILGFGSYHYRYASGREGDAAAAGFAPRKAALTVYFPYGFDGLQDGLARLGPHTTGASCLYVRRLADVDLAVLEDLVRASYARVTADAPA